MNTTPEKTTGPRISARLTGWTLMPLRLMVGFGFAAHGYAKLARGTEAFAEILTAMGIFAPIPMAWATALLELLGGISLMLGAAVTPLSVPLATIMLTALLEVHLQYGFSSIRLKAVSSAGAEFGPIGIELNLLYIAALLALALSEPTRWSIDRWRASRAVPPKDTPTARSIPATPDLSA